MVRPCLVSGGRSQSRNLASISRKPGSPIGRFAPTQRPCWWWGMRGTFCTRSERVVSGGSDWFQEGFTEDRPSLGRWTGPPALIHPRVVFGRSRRPVGICLAHSVALTEGAMAIRRWRLAWAAVLAMAGCWCLAARAEAYVYWANAETGTIGRANLNGAGVKQRFIIIGGLPLSVAVNGEHIYWADIKGNTIAIGRANLNGANANHRFIVDGGTGSLAVDGQHIYWANAKDNTIGRANLNGTGVNQRFITGANAPQEVAVDGQHIYWANSTCCGHATSIGRANLNGTGVNQRFITDPNQLGGLAVDDEHIYWTNTGTGTIAREAGTIGRANLNGTGVNQRFIAGAVLPGGVAVDCKHVYWTNFGNGTIGRANLNGRSVNQSFISGASDPAGIAVN